MPRPTLLCLASHFKGGRFLEAAHDAGARVLLLTREKFADEPWPMHAVDERFLMPVLHHDVELRHAVSYLARTRTFDRIVGLDEYDTPLAADLREHFRLPGLSASHARLFRDKLAMRVRAREAGVAVPDFVHLVNDDALRAFADRTPAPWVLKPRTEASAMGIHRLDRAEQLWAQRDALGDRHAQFLVEQFLPGDVYHVDSLVWDGEVVFCAPSVYGRPPMQVYQQGGVFLSRTVPPSDPVHDALHALNAQLLAAFGLEQGAAHVEFIRAEADGALYFLEAAARVGGAGIDVMVEAATGVNLWDGWARAEVAAAGGPAFALPERRAHHAGLVVCLARQPHPDLSAYDDPEVYHVFDKEHHAQMVLAGPDPDRVQTLLHTYARRFADDFLTTAPPQEQAED